MTKNNLTKSEIERILSLVSGQSAEKRFVRQKKLNLLQQLRYNFIVSKISRGIPLQYFEKTAAFYGNDFAVNKNVLVPRPETETLVAVAIAELENIAREKDNINVIDIGTGSGCIILSVYNFVKQKLNSDKFSKINFFATDLSKKALTVAKKNAQRQKANIKFLNCDLLENVNLPKKFDLVIANLPYLKPDFTDQNKALAYEPAMALDGGKDGLEIIFRLLESLKNRLAESGTAFLEIDPDQADMIKTKFADWFKITRLKDLNGRVRFIKVIQNVKRKTYNYVSLCD
jgi:release factor glutamine methyltransferase